MGAVILKDQYEKVFDKEGNIKPCGRVECMKLITLCYALDKSGTDYGNVDTGNMNVENIKKLYSE